MAILQPSTSHNNPFAEQLGDELVPAGTFPAVVIAIKDRFGLERPRYKSQELEKVDLTTFLFGYRDNQGAPHKIASRSMRISGNEKSALFEFLKQLLGKAPDYGWDYCELKGHKCLLTVEHVRRRDGTGVFASVVSATPILAAPVAPAPAQPAPPPPGFVRTTPPAQPPAPPANEAADDDVPF